MPVNELTIVRDKFLAGELTHDELKRELRPVADGGAEPHPNRRGTFEKAVAAGALRVSAALTDMAMIYEAAGEHLPEVFLNALRHAEEVMRGPDRSG